MPEKTKDVENALLALCAMALRLVALPVLLVFSLVPAFLIWLFWTASGVGEHYFPHLPEVWRQPTFGGVYCLYAVFTLAMGVGRTAAHDVMFKGK